MSTGRLIGADEAHAAGLFRSVHEPEELMAAAQTLAREIADNTSAVSVAAIRRMLWLGLAVGDPREAHLLESRMMYERGASADAREGVESFVQKRSPRFPDRVSAAYPERLKQPPSGRGRRQPPA